MAVARTQRTRGDRYGLALLATAAGLLGTVALLAVDPQPTYAPMIGAVLLSAWLGGFGPALFSLVVGWLVALWVVVEPRGTVDFGDSTDMTRWSVNLGLATLIVAVAGLLRVGRQRASEAREEAESSLGRAAALQALSADLAGAASSTEVSHALARRAAALFDAQAAALGLLESEDVVAIEPIGFSADMHVPARTLALDSATVLTAAVTRGELVVVPDREALEREFPESAAIMPSIVQSVVAVPVQRGGRRYGVAEFLFDRPTPLDDEMLAVAATVAALSEQALERARLYERERQTRTALDRILQVAPRFYSDSAEEVMTAICHEARTTFGSDYGVLWRIDDGTLELVRSDPVREEWPPGLRVPLADFPGLRDAVDHLGVSFVPDVLEEATGEGRERVLQLGIRSSLRSPIAVGGKAELVLVVSWQTVVDDPDPTTVVIVRRFADQAGLAIGRLERLRAEQEAAARANETERLQEVTAALSLAVTGVDVGDTCLEHALRFVGAGAGFVVLSGSGGTSVQMVSTTGYSEEALAAWRELGLDADVPFARAIASGEPVWALTDEEMGAFRGAPALGERGWISIPLSTPAGIHGALHLALHESRELSEADRRWLQSVVSQCALALERSQLYEEEQRLRAQSERLQRTIARLSNAVTQSEVGEVIVDSVAGGIADASVGLYAVSAERNVARRIAGEESASEAETRGEVALDGDSPIAEAIREARWWTTADAAAGTLRDSLIVPLVAGRRGVGALELTWDGPVSLSDDDADFLGTLTTQGALALERARHFEAERSIAETLQRSVLPVALPRVPGVQIAARYLPGTHEVAVGGDWFDAVELSDGRIGLVVGDVVGKGVHAAASMGQLRNALRAISIERLKPPSALARLDRLASDALDTSFATVVYAIVDTAAGMLRFSSAGHPPPVVAYADGRVELLEGARGLPLGTGLGPKYRQSSVELPAGSMLVLYSDGLVERRGTSIDEGISALVAAIAAAPKDAERMLEHVLQELVAGEDRADDVAILATRFLPVAPQPLDLTVPGEDDSLHLVRDAIRTWLDGSSLTRHDSEDLLLAAWEICANAVEHAADPREDTIRVRASVDESRIRMVVVDTGRFVEVEPRQDRGLGLRLANELASSVDITTTSTGTTVALEKRIPEGDEAT